MKKKTILLIILAVGVLLGIIIPPPPVPQFGSDFRGEVIDVAINNNLNLKGVKIICDESGSMRGYVDFAGLGTANNNIIGTVSTFVNRMSQHFIPVELFAVCGEQRYNSAERFINELRANNVFRSGSSLLWDLIDKGVKYASDSTVSVILSDMVLSYGSQPIISNNDLQYNQHHLDGLKGAVSTQMTNAKQKGLDVVVVQYMSDFNGKYYYNSQENFESLSPQRRNNHYVDKKMERRPYYIMLIGEENNLKAIIDKGCCQSCTNMHASFVTETPVLRGGTKYDIKPSDNGGLREEVWRVGHYADDKVDESGFYCLYTPDEFTSFEITCNNVNLPRYYYSNSNSFEAECKGPVERATVTYSNNAIGVNLTTKVVNQEFEPGEKGEFSIEVFAKNDWIKDSSADNDVASELGSIEGKTWGLETLFDGINSVYYPQSYVGKTKIGSVTIKYYVNK